MTDAQIAIAIVYFLPAFVAAIRGHMSQSAIAVLNLLTGWTIIGWVWALVWACTGNTKANRRPIEVRLDGRVREISQAEQPRANRPSLHERLWVHPERRNDSAPPTSAFEDWLQKQKS